MTILNLIFWILVSKLDLFLDFGKYGSIFIPRQFSLKINYLNNNVLINYFHNKRANIKTCWILLITLDWFVTKNNNDQKKFLNKKLFNNFKVKW